VPAIAPFVSARGLRIRAVHGLPALLEEAKDLLALEEPEPAGRDRRYRELSTTCGPVKGSRAECASSEAHCVAAPSALIGASNFFELAVAAAISLITVIATSSAVSAGTAGRNLINLRLGMILEVASAAGTYF